MSPLPRYANLALKRCSDNRDRAFAMSAATVGKLKMHPPVPREKALVVVEGPAPDSFLPSFDYDEDVSDAYSFKYA